MAGEYELIVAQVDTPARRERLIQRLSRLVKHIDDCVEFQGTTNNQGYEKLNFWYLGKHKQVYAHRFFWVLKHRRPIPVGYEPHHTCHNRRCVRHFGSKIDG